MLSTPQKTLQIYTTIPETTTTEDNTLAFTNVEICISLHYDDYKQHKDGIQNIIKKYLGENKFKILNLEALEEHLQTITKEWEKYQTELASDGEATITGTNYPALATVLVNIYKNPVTHDVDKQIPSYLEKQTIFLESLKNKDKFILSIPQNHSQENIANLCQELHDYIVKKDLRPGHQSNIAQTFSPYINIKKPLKKNLQLSSTPSYSKAFLYTAAGIALLFAAIGLGLSGAIPISMALFAAAIKAFIVAIGLVTGVGLFLYGTGNIVQKTLEPCCSLRK